MKTIFVIGGLPKCFCRSIQYIICAIISDEVRLRRNCCVPVLQNLHPIRHPTCDDMQIVFRRSSGIKTVSTQFSSVNSSRAFAVPSDDSCKILQTGRSSEKNFGKFVLTCLGTSDISSKDIANFV